MHEQQVPIIGREDSPEGKKNDMTLNSEGMII